MTGARNITRAQYHDRRRESAKAYREVYGEWSDLGAEFCPDCGGEGVCETVDSAPSNATEPTYREIQCDGCDGHGVRCQKGFTDPVYALWGQREALKRAKARGQVDPWQRNRYDLARMRFVRPVSGLAMADMRAMAVRCVTRTDELRARFAA